MKTLKQQMAVYAAYHRNRWNKLTHFAGVPTIIFALLVPLGWVRVPFGGIEVTLAMVFVLTVVAYYCRLDAPLAIATGACIAPLLYAAEIIARMPWPIGLAIFLATFIGGWALQLIGHALEGRKPALADNFFQVFIAPIFLLAEITFALGFRHDLLERVERLSHQHDAPSRAV